MVNVSTFSGIPDGLPAAVQVTVINLIASIRLLISVFKFVVPFLIATFLMPPSMQTLPLGVSFADERFLKPTKTMPSDML